MTFYLQHFGLREAPFGATPMTEFFYGGGRRGEILHTLQYAINAGEGIVMVTGEVGSGKTMLLRSLLEKLGHQDMDLVYIPNPSLSGREILYNICEELELRMDENRPDTVRMLQNCLIDRYAQGRRVVALIDEAQAMPDDSLEEIRLLSNLETARGKLLQIVLFGQPELEDKLRQQTMRQLRERITLALELKPFGLDDVRDYISTRLNAAGFTGGSLFSGGALRTITAVSQGLSRRINVLADKCLLSAFERQSMTVTSADAKRAVEGAKYGKFQFYAEQKQDAKKPLPWKRAALAFGAAAVVVVAVAAFGIVGGWFDDKAQSEQSAQVESPITEQSETNETTTAEDATLRDEDAILAQQQESAPPIENAPVDEPEALIRQPADGEQPPLLVSDSDTPPNDGLLPPQQDAALPGETIETTQSPPAAEDQNLDAVQTPTTEVATTEVEAQDQSESDNDNNNDNNNNESAGASDYVVDNTLPQFLMPGGVASDDIGDDARWRDMPKGSYLRARLNVTQAFAKTERGKRGWTGRLMTVRQGRAVLLDAFLRRFGNFYPIGNVLVYPVRLGGSERFVVTFGIYDNRDNASVFVKNIPVEFTDGKPFAQSLEESAREAAAF